MSAFKPGDLVCVIASNYNIQYIGVITKIISFEKPEKKSLIWCLWESGKVNYIYEMHIEKRV